MYEIKLVVWNSVQVKVTFISYQECLINLNDNKLKPLIILCHFMIENKSNSRISVPASAKLSLLIRDWWTFYNLLANSSFNWIIMSIEKCAN